MSFWKQSMLKSIELLKQLCIDDFNLDKLDHISTLIKTQLKDNKNIFIAGNGGSHADALHFAEELTGRFRKEREPIGAIALGEATHTTCTSNDYGFEEVFSRQLKGLGKSGDIFIALSTSGDSANLINAIMDANEKKMYTVAFLGKGGGLLKGLADVEVIVPGETSDRIQELHMLLLHTLVEEIENA